MKKFLVAFLFLLVLFQPSLRADDIPFRGNRVKGETTVITLTREQKKVLKAQSKVRDKWDIRRIKLTKEQKNLLKKAGVYAPAEIEVWPLACAKDTCACGLINIGIRFKKNKVEIPHFLLAKGRGGLYDTPEEPKKSVPE